jgi:hypothetical protein
MSTPIPTQPDTDTTPTTPRQVFASLVGLAAGIFAWRWAWSRLWDWQFRGLITDGADSVWNREPFHGLILAGLTVMETFIAATMAGLLAYGVALLALAILRGIGRWCGLVLDLSYPERVQCRAQRHVKANSAAEITGLRAWSVPKEPVPQTARPAPAARPVQAARPAQRRPRRPRRG